LLFISRSPDNLQNPGSSAHAGDPFLLRKYSRQNQTLRGMMLHIRTFVPKNETKGYPQMEEFTPQEAIDEEGAFEDQEHPVPYGLYQQRLFLLRGMPCPLCEGRRQDVPTLLWTGVSLACARGHGWSNPEALRADALRLANPRKVRLRALAVGKSREKTRLSAE
jgi:hypothetical protein